MNQVNIVLLTAFDKVFNCIDIQLFALFLPCLTSIHICKCGSIYNSIRPMLADNSLYLLLIRDIERLIYISMFKLSPVFTFRSGNKLNSLLTLAGIYNLLPCHSVASCY